VVVVEIETHCVCWESPTGPVNSSPACGAGQLPEQADRMLGMGTTHRSCLWLAAAANRAVYHKNGSRVQRTTRANSAWT